MSTKAIYEVTGKQILNKYLDSTAAECRCISVNADTNWNEFIANNRWLETEVLMKFFVFFFSLIIFKLFISLVFGR